MYFAKCYSLKSTKENLIKNLHRKIATWPYYYYCPLVDLLIYILCGVSIIMSSIWLKNCISANTAERDSPPSEITGGINITERKNQHRSSFYKVLSTFKQFFGTTEIQFPTHDCNRKTPCMGLRL